MDIATMRGLLSSRGVATNDPLIKRNASLSAVQTALLDLANVTGEGDLSIFYFAGHGVGLADYSGDDEDHSDEALVCEDGFLVDDWFAGTFWPKARPGSSWVMVVDACASASSVRSLTGGSLIIYPEPPVLGMCQPHRPRTVGSDSERQEETTGELPALPALTERSAEPPPRSRIVFAACSDLESAAELPDSGGQRARGLYTTQLTETLRKHPDLSHAQLAQRVRDAVRTYRLPDGAHAAEPVCYYDSHDESLLNRRALSGDPAR
ncbi:caspase family protein [Cellulomonas fengjieae]|nr:caspase family protein [Cellulomonas fengjieae]